MNCLLSILIVAFVINLFSYCVNAIGSPASTHPPSDIDWNSLDSIFEIPSLDIQQSANPIKEDQRSKRKKNQSAPSKSVSYQNQQKRVQEDKEYAKRRQKQVNAASRKYRAKIKTILSPNELKERRLKRNEKERLNYKIKRTLLSSSQIEEEKSKRNEKARLNYLKRKQNKVE